MIFLLTLALVNPTVAGCTVVPPTPNRLQSSIEYISRDSAKVLVSWSNNRSAPTAAGYSGLLYAVSYKDSSSRLYSSVNTTNASFLLPSPQGGRSYLVKVSACVFCASDNTTVDRVCSDQSEELRIDLRYIQSVTFTPKTNALQILCTLVRVTWTTPGCLVVLQSSGFHQSYYLRTISGSMPPVAFEKITGLDGGAYVYTVTALDYDSSIAIGRVNITGNTSVKSPTATVSVGLIVLIIVAVICTLIVVVLVIEVIRHYSKASGIGCGECCSNYKEYCALCCVCSTSHGQFDLTLEGDDTPTEVDTTRPQTIKDTPTHIMLRPFQAQEKYDSEV